MPGIFGGKIGVSISLMLIALLIAVAEGVALAMDGLGIEIVGENVASLSFCLLISGSL